MRRPNVRLSQVGERDTSGLFQIQKNQTRSPQELLMPLFQVYVLNHNIYLCINATAWMAWWWWACLFSLITKIPNERMFRGGKRAPLMTACKHNQPY